MAKEEGELESSFDMRRDLYNRIMGSRYSEYADPYSRAITNSVVKGVVYPPDVVQAIDMIVKEIGFKV